MGLVFVHARRRARCDATLLLRGAEAVVQSAVTRPAACLDRPEDAPMWCRARLGGLSFFNRGGNNYWRGLALNVEEAQAREGVPIWYLTAWGSLYL